MRQFYNSHISDSNSLHKGYYRQKYVKEEQISLPCTISKYFVLGSDTMDNIKKFRRLREAHLHF
jgi:hypothetical protein